MSKKVITDNKTLKKTAEDFQKNPEKYKGAMIYDESTGDTHSWDGKKWQKSN